jgi:hypothetical protein
VSVHGLQIDGLCWLQQAARQLTQPLSINGLVMPADFPTVAFERAYSHTKKRVRGRATQFEHFAAAWNAISFRFLALCDDGDQFSSSIEMQGAEANLQQRYLQERHLFGFFGNGFSTFESFFYGMFAIGSMLDPPNFLLTLPKDQQAVAPGTTNRAYLRAFAGDTILTVFQAVLDDTDYREWKEVRNILTHRTAPGRTIFVSITTDVDLPAVWKINNIALDSTTVPTRRAHASRLLAMLLSAAADFIESRVT